MYTYIVRNSSSSIRRSEREGGEGGRKEENFKTLRRSWSFCKRPARNWPGPNRPRRRSHDARRWRLWGRQGLRAIYRSISLRGSSRLFPASRYTDPDNVGFDCSTRSDFCPRVRAVPRTPETSFPFHPSTFSRTLAVTRWSGTEIARLLLILIILFNSRNFSNSS